jgi:hypothetical protein
MNATDYLSHARVCAIFGKPFMTYFESNLIIKNIFNLTPYNYEK